MKTTVLLSAVGLLTLGLASSAFAQPQECTFGQGATNYWNAKSTYGQQMRNYWEGLNRNCDQQEQVESIFGNYFDETGPIFRKCKNAGQNAAISEVLQEISGFCTISGVIDGVKDGFQYGVQYCQTKGGDYPPAYITSCKAAFWWVVNTFCPGKVTPATAGYAANVCGG